MQSWVLNQRLTDFEISASDGDFMTLRDKLNGFNHLFQVDASRD